MTTLAPPSPRAALDDRLAGLSAENVARVQAAARALRDGATSQAYPLLATVLQASPQHPEVLRLQAMLLLRMGQLDSARSLLRRALMQWPDDVHLLTDLGSVQQDRGDFAGAEASWQRACELGEDQPMAWFNLGRHYQIHGRTEQALERLSRAVALAPDLLPARFLRGDALTHLGRDDEAVSAYRDALALHPACGDAWRGLGNIKARPLSEDDRVAIVTQLQRDDLEHADRIAMGFALGKLLEDQGRYDEAFDALAQANAQSQQIAGWDARAFSTFVDALLTQSQTLPEPLDPRLGHEAILIVGLPRSGSTLFEQILAAHSQVEGGSELHELSAIIAEESGRRGRAFPTWVPQASAKDWHRLGTLYLQRTSAWRARKPRFTDKMPENWLYTGVLQAMLPGAHIIQTRRDALETGWSAFKQQFYQLPHFSNSLHDIGAYTRDCDRALDIWQAQRPKQVHIASYEQLLSEPEAQIRELIDFCELSFEPQCLQFHTAQRSVRTPSASQVRQPLRRDTARAQHYGTRLDPLRHALRGPQGVPQVDLFR